MNNPLTIHVVGAQKSNYPWGFENRIIAALEKMGHYVISTDFRQQVDQLPDLLQQDADLLLVNKGNGIPPELIRLAEETRAFLAAAKAESTRRAYRTDWAHFAPRDSAKWAPSGARSGIRFRG